MVSGINTPGYMDMYKQQANNVKEGFSSTVESASRSFAQCIQTASESQKQSENLSKELKKATSGMSACSKCGAVYMGQEPPPVCAKCGSEVKSSENVPPEAQEDAKANTTNAVSELNSDFSAFSESGAYALL